jgi:DNA replication and repair protein RecF
MIAHGAGKVPYTKDRIQGIFMNQLREKQWEERRQKSSLVGPQRDDLIFVLNGKDARVYASQGQQRTAVLASKLAELDYVAQARGERPLLLLDDVLSELDQQRCERFLTYISQDTQIFLTTTDLGTIDRTSLQGARVSHIRQGRLEQVEKL